ncbi:MAG: GrpB family protein [Proteobacteria bacterium]|nr:MAG: GrpB family protein [Pseudomonadota bacterium]
MNIDEKLEIFLRAGLGLKNDRLQLKPHKTEWLTIAEDEIKRLISAVLPLDIVFHHIGSTAVPNLSAKPILDLVGGIDDLSLLDEATTGMQKQGYTPMGEFGIEGRCFFKFEHEDTTFVHLHVFQNSNPKITEHIAFREELIANPLARKTYEATKLQLEKTVDRKDYSEAKNEIISRLQAKTL